MPKLASKKSDRTFRSAQPRDKTYLIADGDGLSLRVQPSGSKTWLFRYRKPSTGKETFIGLGPYHVAPESREQWRKAEHDLRHGGLLIVRWLDRISRRYDELHRTMRRLLELGVRVECTLNGMTFDGGATDPIEKATRDAILAFMAAQGEADYRNRAEMQRRGVAIAKAEGRYKGRVRTHDYAEIKAWRAEHGASIRMTAEHFDVGTATVKRACAETAASH